MQVKVAHAERWIIPYTDELQSARANTFFRGKRLKHKFEWKQRRLVLVWPLENIGQGKYWAVTKTYDAARVWTRADRHSLHIILKIVV